MKCLVCNSTITGQYYQDYWGNKVCQSHIDNHEVTFCISCGSFVRIGDVTGDGRTLCESCMASVISDAEQVDKLKKYVLRKFMDIGVFFNDKFLDSVSIDIVSPQKMAEIRKNVRIKRLWLKKSHNKVKVVITNINNCVLKSSKTIMYSIRGYTIDISLFVSHLLFFCFHQPPSTHLEAGVVKAGGEEVHVAADGLVDDAGVDLRGREFRVAQHLRDGLYRHAVRVGHGRREGMTRKM